MVSKKAAVLVACGALAAPGVAQATHETGKLGAPGQVCKPLKQQQQASLKEFRSTDPSKEALRTFRAMQRAAYKGCIREAAKKRSEDKQQGEEDTQGGPNVNSEGAPGQVCKPLLRARKAQLKSFRAQDPKPSKQVVREYKQAQQAAYKGCIQGAAKARSENKENQGKGQQS